MNIQSFRTRSGLTGISVKPEKPVARLILVHGLGGDAGQFSEWLNVCHANNIEAYALNLRGHADSRPGTDLGRVSLYDYSLDVEHFVSEHHTGHSPLYVLGQSMGGLVVQTLITRSSMFRGSILLASAPPAGIFLGLPATLRMARWRYLKAMLFNRSFAASDADIRYFGLTGAKSLESGRVLRQVAMHQVKIDPKLIMNSHRMMLIAGDEDRMISPRCQKKLAWKYRPQHIWCVPKMGHMIHVEDNDQTVIKGIIEWIKQG